MQTFGGALVEGDCVCTQLDFHPVDESDATVDNICRDTTVDGELKVATSTIIGVDGASPGIFDETFCPACPAVSYTIAYLDESSLVEFDCSANALGIINYCFHVMSRTPTMDDATLAGLQELMVNYGLNPHGLEWKVTNQTGCGW